MKMKHLAVTAVMSMMAATAMAAPSVAKVGVCTVFDQGNMISSATCSIDITHTAKAKTTKLKTAKDSYVIDGTHNGKDYAKADFSLNGVPAAHYLRDATNNKRVTFDQIQSGKHDVLTCFETMTANICHS